MGAATAGHTDGLTAQLSQVIDGIAGQRHDAHTIVEDGDREVIAQFRLTRVQPIADQQVHLTARQTREGIALIGDRDETDRRGAPEPELNHLLDQADFKAGGDAIGAVGAVGPAVGIVADDQRAAVAHPADHVKVADLRRRGIKRRRGRTTRDLSQGGRRGAGQPAVVERVPRAIGSHIEKGQQDQIVEEGVILPEDHPHRFLGPLSDDGRPGEGATSALKAVALVRVGIHLAHAQRLDNVVEVAIAGVGRGDRHRSCESIATSGPIQDTHAPALKVSKAADAGVGEGQQRHTVTEIGRAEVHAHLGILGVGESCQHNVHGPVGHVLVSRVGAYLPKTHGLGGAKPAPGELAGQVDLQAGEPVVRGDVGEGLQVVAHADDQRPPIDDARRRGHCGRVTGFGGLLDQAQRGLDLRVRDEELHQIGAAGKKDEEEGEGENMGKRDGGTVRATHRVSTIEHRTSGCQHRDQPPLSPRSMRSALNGKALYQTPVARRRA